jgi:DHA2 family multidrug resistance protein-like MFS transporter
MTLGIYTLAFFIHFAAFFFITQYLQLVVGLGPLEAAFWTLPWAVSQIVGSLLAPVFARRSGSTAIIVLSFGVAAMGFAILTQIGGRDDLWVLVAGSVLYAFAIIQVITLATDLIVGAAPPERAGMASGLSETSSELGGALGIALIGSAAVALYRNALSNTLPSGVPPSVAEVAKNSLGGALAVAEQLPEGVETALSSAARAAFTHATVLAFALCASIALVTALSALITLQRSMSNTGNGLIDKQTFFDRASHTSGSGPNIEANSDVYQVATGTLIEKGGTRWA